MYLNKAIIYGNLTRDPELRSLPSGIKVASFSVATNRVYKDQSGAKKESVDYHNIVAFGRQGELVAEYLRRGSSALIEGRIQTRSWDDKDGQKKYRTEIVADRIQFGPKSSGGGKRNENSNPETGSKDEASDKGDKGAIDYPDEEINPDDIPF